MQNSMLFLTSKFCLLTLCCTKTDTTTRHDTHFCCEGHQSCSHEGSRLLKSSTCLSSGSLARERIAPSGMSSPCRQTNNKHHTTNQQTNTSSSKSECHMGCENLQKGNGHVFVLDPVEVSDVPRLALTTNYQKGVEHARVLWRALCTELFIQLHCSNSGADRR